MLCSPLSKWRKDWRGRCGHSVQWREKNRDARGSCVGEMDDELLDIFIRALPTGIWRGRKRHGVAPTSKSLAYKNKAITLSSSAMLKAIAFNGINASTVATAAFVIYVSPAPVIATSSPLPAAPLNQGYSEALQVATGTGIGTLKWALLPGSKLPTGLTLNAATGLISGKATKLGAVTFSVKVTDAKKRASDPNQFSLTVQSAAP